jgi:hypothetical protein
MKFEPVHTIGDYYDGPRTGTADFNGAPHYFVSWFDDVADDYVDHFKLYPITSEFLEKETRRETIFLAWQHRFRQGFETEKTHPARGGMDSEYDALTAWLAARVETLAPLPNIYTATFRARPDQASLPLGTTREMEVAWVVG